MKYYLYVSDDKVSMIFSQIPQSIKTRIVTEIKIDLGIISTTFKDKDAPDGSTRYSRLDIVLKYLEKHKGIDTVESSDAYFRGETEMYWGEFPNTGLVYFTGIINDTIIALGGSLKHVLGHEKVEELQKKPASRTVGIEKSLVEEFELAPLIDVLQQQDDSAKYLVTNADEMSVIWAVKEANRKITGTKQRLEFVARRLCESEPTPPKVVLGTPIYVALVD